MFRLQKEGAQAFSRECNTRRTPHLKYNSAAYRVFREVLVTGCLVIIFMSNLWRHASLMAVASSDTMAVQLLSCLIKHSFIPTVSKLCHKTKVFIGMRGCWDHVKRQCDTKQQYYFYTATRIWLSQGQNVSHDLMKEGYYQLRSFSRYRFKDIFGRIGACWHYCRRFKCM